MVLKTYIENISYFSQLSTTSFMGQYACQAVEIRALSGGLIEPSVH